MLLNVPTVQLKVAPLSCSITPLMTKPMMAPLLSVSAPYRSGGKYTLKGAEFSTRLVEMFLGDGPPEVARHGIVRATPT